MSTLYQDLIEAGIVVSNHHSDLYMPASPEALSILDRYPLQKGNSRRFINQAPPHKGEQWVGVPFAFLPWWAQLVGRNIYRHCPYCGEAIQAKEVDK